MPYALLIKGIEEHESTLVTNLFPEMVNDIGEKNDEEKFKAENCRCCRSFPRPKIYKYYSGYPLQEIDLLDKDTSAGNSERCTGISLTGFSGL